MINQDNIIYEVNVCTHADIADEYYSWLREHTQQMLSFSGFKEVSILKEIKSDVKNLHYFTVHYYVESLHALEQYLSQHAEYMRAQALEKFSGQFAVSRRVFAVVYENRQ